MVIIVWLGIFLALFYSWLVGNWFARVLMCILLVLTFGGLGAAAGGDKNPGGAIMLALIGGGVGWAAGSAPVWYWRKRIIVLRAASDERDAQLTRETIERFNRRHGLTG
jgi:hypothetical protein